MLKHFKQYSSWIKKNYSNNIKKIIEIGSNDGSFLRNFKSKNTNILGIEPSSNVANIAKKNGIKTINSFFKYKFKINPKIAILGLNPHCETKSKFNEENLIIKPAVKKLKKMKININGPFPADTFFIKKNIYYFEMFAFT